MSALFSVRPRPFARALIVTCVLAGVVLPASAAFTITGVVRNEAGTGLANVDIDLVDICSGVNVFLVNDKTAVDGTFSVVVNPGTYDIHFTPPTGSTVASSELENVTIAANADFGTIVLHPGFLVSGQVRNTSAAGIPGVGLRFVNLATGKRVYVTKDATTSTGAYSVRVLPGSYDIEYRPPSTTTYLTVRRKGVVVSSDVSGLVDTLGVGVNVNGTVTDSGTVAVQNVDVDLYDVCTGQRVPTAHDNTSSQGIYSVYVPSGTYSIHYNPPSCKGLAALRLSDQAVDQNRTIDATLTEAFAVSGRVLDDLGQPVLRATIKFFIGSSRQGATNDDTDALGDFSILMAPDTYGVNVEPPAGRDLLVTHVSQVDVSADIDLGDIELLGGIPVSGVLLGPGGTGVENVNVNVLDSATRANLRLAHDSTAADGTFRVVVPPGTYDFQYSPPVCRGLAPADQKGVTVSAPVNLPTLHLVAGVHVTGRVVDSSGFAVDLAELDFFTPGTDDKFFTPNDRTDASGNYDVFVQPGTYDILYTPPSGSGLAPRFRRGVAVNSDVSLPDTVLLPLTVPSVSSVSPPSGTTAGGQTVTIGGNGFQPDATVRIGGVAATNVVVASATSLTCTTPPHPAGTVSVRVTNPGNQVSSVNGSYTYSEPPGGGVQLRVARSGANVVLTWSPTGQASYTVFRNTSPTGFTEASILTTTAATTYTDPGAASGSGIAFYAVE